MSFFQLQDPEQLKNSVDFDPLFHAVVTQGIEHTEIHAGDHFYVCGKGTYAADEQVEFQLTTPDTTKWAHMTFNIQSTGETVFSIFEDATVGAGTTVTAFNNNRNSNKTTDLTLLQIDGSASVAGACIFSSSFGKDGNPNQLRGGSVERNKEIILKQNSTYRFLIESNSAGNIISYCGNWYEHTNK